MKVAPECRKVTHLEGRIYPDSEDILLCDLELHRGVPFHLSQRILEIVVSEDDMS
jgi:hypothetical protein